MSPNDPEPTIAPPPPTEHRVVYHRELEELTAAVIRLGAMACETIPRGTEVLLGGNLAAAQTLIEEDDQIDRLAVEIEDKAFQIIALQAPMASELRRLMAVIKLVAEVERSADLVVNICKAARRMYGANLTPKCRGILAAMAEEANKMLRLSIDAFADENTSLAVALGDIDDELDQLNRDIVEAILEAHHKDDLELTAAVQLALIARYYERIGDHAVNIGERVNYMVTGWTPEHTGMLRADHREANKDQTDDGSTDPGGAAPGPDD